MVVVSECFEQDVGLTYKLLNYINSGIVPIKSKISSIKQALIYLGESQVRKLLILFTTASMAVSKPQEIIRVAITRARACELVAEKVLPGSSGEAFLVGLLSQIPAILDKSMEEILENLPVSEEIKSTLIESQSNTLLRTIYDAVTLYESGLWHLCSIQCYKLRMNYDELGEYMLESMNWANCYSQIEQQKKKMA